MVKIILNKLILFFSFIHIKFILHLVKIKVPKLRIIIHNLIFIRLHRLFIYFFTIDSNIILTRLTTLSFHSFIHFFITLFLLSTILHSFLFIIRFHIIFFINRLLTLFVILLVFNVKLFLIFYLLWFLVSNIILFYFILDPFLQLWKRGS